MEFEFSDTLALFSGNHLQPKKLYMLTEAVPDESPEGQVYTALQLRLVALTEEEFNKDYELDDFGVRYAKMPGQKFPRIRRKNNGIPAS